MISKIPRLLGFLITVVFVSLIVLFGMRIVFWIMFNNAADPLPFPDTLYSFYLGTKFDLRLTLLVVLPILLLGWIKPFGPMHNKIAAGFWLTYLVLAASTVLFFYLIDFGHYAYLYKRLDATFLRFAANFYTSMHMVWQSYNVIPWSIFIISLITLDAYAMYRIWRYFYNLDTPPLKIRHKLWVAPLSFFLLLFGIYGKFSWYPLRWSDAFFSTHAFAASVSTNPVLYFFDTLKNKNVTFSKEQTQRYYDVISDYLGVEDKNRSTLNYKRVYTPAKKSDKKPNVIIVFLESFASYKTGAFGNPLNPTPHFDALAQKGLLFTQFYTPHTGTARSVFAAVTGLPDVELNKTSSRNPLVVDQHTIINDFVGYENFYFIGGSANWGNIRGILSHNIHDLKLYEEGSYKAPDMDVWGISDLHLFEEAAQTLAQHSEPFFAIIQTSGNHRPYNIPEDNRGFERIDTPPGNIGEAGFISIDEFNSFRFMDHSLGFFMEQARKHPFYENTIFVFFGDHGITGYGGKHTPAYMSKFELTGFHVPLLIYMPSNIDKAQQIDKVASEIDLLPTIAGLAGIPYTNTTLGRDLLDTTFDNARYAFTIEHSRNPKLGLLGDRFYFRALDNGKITKLHDIQSNDPNQNVIEQHPQVAAKMSELLSGIYETTRYMLYHNKNEKTDGESR